MIYRSQEATGAATAVRSSDTTGTESEREVVIRIDGLQKIYKSGDFSVHALRGVSLNIFKGDFVAIMGTSGSGKSTMMNLLGCLDRPTSGHYYFGDKDVSNLHRDELAVIRNEKIGFVFQGFNLLSRTTALDNVQLPLIYAGKYTAKQRRDRAIEMLKMVGLAERLDHHPNQLSGGQQQRVAIARALVNHPTILLADEPTGNLDSRTGLEILAEFQRLNKEKQQTIVMVTHDKGIADCCLRQIVMQDGKVKSDIKTPRPRDAAAELKELIEQQRLEAEQEKQ